MSQAWCLSQGDAAAVSEWCLAARSPPPLPAPPDVLSPPPSAVLASLSHVTLLLSFGSLTPIVPISCWQGLWPASSCPCTSRAANLPPATSHLTCQRTISQPPSLNLSPPTLPSSILPPSHLSSYPPTLLPFILSSPTLAPLSLSPTLPFADPCPSTHDILTNAEES